ncbi:hypothetical protein CEP51_001482 [Fusarium floridanum]|uniref:Uncharacterized protein n=1 Tax=Fusarium floridanum TaxID=1325733 RepID=A0A428SGK4_9HYPO|nr:hypothetical protein CEP51_001482 [Fusarium floridanum]
MSEPITEEYTIGWICALQEEFEAACRMLDDEYDGLEAADPNDDNTYVFGRIHKHNVVIGCLPSGIYGTTSAACVARDMVRSFPNLRFALMAGIGGGAPTPERDIRLGDVVVSEPKGELGGVVQYDLGKRLSDGEFKRTGQLNAPPRVLLGALPEVRRRHNDPRKRHPMAENLARMDDMPEYSRPASDKLYRVESRHRSGKTCDECDSAGLVERPSRPSDRAIAIHYGTIASGNTVMKDATERDRHASDPALNVLCFEMEAAGLMNNFPCLVIRGICDYSDDHKNDEWHNYAALTAAAYARDLLGIVRPQKVVSQPAWAGKIESLLGEFCENIKEVVDHKRSEEEEKLWQWVSPIDHFKTQTDKSRSRSPETRAGQWLFDSAEFKEFLSGPGKSLFCPGIPGAGKTVLTSVVVDYLLKLRKGVNSNEDGKIGLAFIYLDFKQQFELVHFLGSIIRQLAPDNPSALASIRERYGNNDKERRPLPLSKAQDILRSMVPSFSKLFIVVDALDEGEQDLSGQLLSEIFYLQRAHEANIFATSRHIPDIERKFEGAEKLEIRAIDEDVRNYVDSYMTKLPRFVIRSPELQEETKTSIVNAIGGMFLLASFHLASLVGAKSIRAFRDTLRSLPKGTNAYDQAYGLALDRIKGQVQNKRDLAIEALSWLVCARRQLKTRELQLALAVIVGSTQFDESNIPDMDDVVSVCAGLVVVDPGRHIVRLVHYTAQEYFEREKEKRLPDAQSYLTTSCLAYLSLGYFEADSGAYGNYFRSYEHHHFYEYGWTPFGWASFKGQAEVVSLLLDMGEVNTDVGNTDPGDPLLTTPLHLAAMNGHFAVMKLVLTRCHFDVNAPDERKDTPLHLAMIQGRKDMVEILVDHGAAANLHDSDYKELAGFAIGSDSAAIIKLLLEKRECKFDDVLLLIDAASAGSLAIVKFLIDEWKVDADKTEQAWVDSAMVKLGEYKTILDLLVEKGADLEVEDDYGDTLK